MWICAESPLVDDVSSLLELRTEIGVQFLTFQLFHPRLRRGDAVAASRLGPRTRSDRIFKTNEWVDNFIAMTSCWIDADSPCSSHRAASEVALMEELSRTSHLSLRMVLLPHPSRDPSNYARLLLRHCDSTAMTQQQLLVTIPWVVPLSARFESSACTPPPSSPSSFAASSTLPPPGYSLNQGGNIDGAQSDDSWDGWRLWHTLQMAIDLHSKVSVALEVTEDVLGLEQDCLNSTLRRWGAEPVKLLLLPTRMFIRNDAGFPVLSKCLQQVVLFFLHRGVGVHITGRPWLPSLQPFVQYIRHLQHRVEQSMSAVDKYIRPYRDVLQVPLQPLGDNLEASTYETFEADPVKYRLYQRAITQALVDVLSRKRRPPSPPPRSEPPGLGPRMVDVVAALEASSPAEAVGHTTKLHTVRVVVYVVGAGRGPLIAASLSAASEVNSALEDPHCLPELSLQVAALGSTRLELQVIALEKNPEAIVTLRNRHSSEAWGNTVAIIASDMRQAIAFSEPADIVVSELLGSFGDNELSPECLRGFLDCHAARFLCPSPSPSSASPGMLSAADPVGEFPGAVSCPVSVPSQYGSWIQPVSCALPFMCARDLHLATPLFGPGAPTHVLPASRHPSGLQSPYVTNLHRFCTLAAAPQLAWEFHHPFQTVDEQQSDRRQCELRFTADITASMHGFVGYFSSVLYGDVVMSILPETHSPDMASWFPIYLPLVSPVLVHRGQEIVLHMWRCRDAHRVWYEWSLSKPQRTAVHNLQGRCYSVTL